jgi:glycerophosphoryl diester phosphodiesterase
MKPVNLNAPCWLTARPIAHRGLHSSERGIVENTLAAAEAALAGNYSVECDVQITREGEAVVFHDATVDRLMAATGHVDSFTANELSRLTYKDCDQKIVSLHDFLAFVGGRVPVIVDIKSHYDGDIRLAARTVAIIEDFPWPVSLKSLDPQVLMYLRHAGAGCPVGLIARADYADEEWAGLARDKLERLADLSDFPLVKPDFLSWNHIDLPHAVPMLCRSGIGMPVMTWAVNSAEAGSEAKNWADQIIFEGFEP